MGGRAGRTGINVYRGREMGPVELEMGPEGPVCQKVLGGGGKNWLQTQLQRYTSHGRRGRGLGVPLRACRDGNLAGEPCHVCGGSAICLKGIQRSCPVKEWNIDIFSNMEGTLLSKITQR